MAQMDADEEARKERCDMAEDDDPLTYAIIGAAMEVHRHLGKGFLEPVYQDALEVEFRLRSIPCRREVEVPVIYKGELLKAKYKSDFICYDSIILELKALSGLVGAHEAQIINYLKATGLGTGLLINFGTSQLEFRRFACSPRPHEL
jgi:GxxExxY protein